MSNAKRKSRWWQFSLRSVLLLTLAVALWLGYEVRQARQVERTVGAIRAIGGGAECEPTGWSLLRLCGVPGYGQRIVRAEIPGSAVEEAIAVLRDLPDSCELQVAYDGTFDPTPSWQAINGEIRNRKIAPVVIEDATENDEGKEETELGSSRIGRRMTRFRSSLRGQPPDTEDLRQILAEWTQDRHYHLLVLRDGTLAELLIGNTWASLARAKAFFCHSACRGRVRRR